MLFSPLSPGGRGVGGHQGNGIAWPHRMKRGLAMPRMLALFTGPWTDQPLEVVAGKASEWGYQALDLACWGEHLAVQKALAEPEYCRSILSMMEQHELSIISLSNHPVGQAVADRLDARHQASQR